ncbi:uncharacterized protein B0H18DRAFT_1129844 [Fomitopsis serialis]|uniref:uncharacterized protein n=1 Tax=Fomitopsis serialis TaxID=139415 RepID=UPI002007360B|nr:uncharacterized protein B0H18DRAFT_1129844 [Neoantrodia serialis]KAH9910565.1 hypothetical protein B0H18DRAFT_1129844 [Neoantrodia serialis]
MEAVVERWATGVRMARSTANVQRCHAWIQEALLKGDSHSLSEVKTRLVATRQLNLTTPLVENPIPAFVEGIRVAALVKARDSFANLNLRKTVEMGAGTKRKRDEEMHQKESDAEIAYIIDVATSAEKLDGDPDNARVADYRKRVRLVTPPPRVRAPKELQISPTASDKAYEDKHVVEDDGANDEYVPPRSISRRGRGSRSRSRT